MACRREPSTAEDPIEVATLLFSATGWTYRHMRSGRRWSAERTRGRLVSLLINGVI